MADAVTEARVAENVKLAECPFCGRVGDYVCSPAHPDSQLADSHYVQCMSCGSSTDGYTSKDAAIGMWNQRRGTYALRLEAELEQERVRLAGCSAAATGYADNVKPGDYGYSASLDDVRRLYHSRLAATRELHRLGKQLMVLQVLLALVPVVLTALVVAWQALM